MRIAVFAMTVLALAACKVSKNEENETVTAEFNQDVAENELQAAANEAENIAADVTNDVKDTASKVENEADDIKADVKDENKAN
jgi:hypothetical protein